MRCAPVIVLRASSTVRQAIRQLENAQEHVDAVLVREHGGDVLYYVFSAGSLRARLARGQPDADVATALRLGEYQPTVAVQLSPATPVGSVALEGRHVVGVIVDDGADRGVRGGGRRVDIGGTTAEPSAAPAQSYEQPSPPPPHRGGVTTRGPAFAPDVSEEPAGPVTRGGITMLGRGPMEASADISTAAPPTPPGLFRAYPDVRAPGQVSAGDAFTLSVGFSKEPPPAMLIKGDRIEVPAEPRAEFVIQVAGFGFTFPNGIQKTLIVDRDDPESDRVDFTVKADTSEIAAPRFVEVSYEYAGIVVGRAWARVQVVPGAPTEMAKPALVGGSGLVGSLAPGEGPHLTVDIVSQDGDPKLHWRFHCRYPDVERPGEVTTNLQDHSAQSFAVQLMRKIPNVPPGPLLTATMKGIGERVADALPAEFWPIFEQTWKRAHADGAEPRLQITTTEPWIPWELAWISKDRLYHPDDLLPDPKGRVLGQLWQVGRWTPPARHLATGDVPATPPVSQVDAAEMAVIFGNYAGERGIAQLPNAVQEGQEIAMAYGALPLGISDTDVVALLECTLQRDGQPFRPTVIHFAGHGQTDVDNPEFTGLVLAHGIRLDPYALQGFDLVEQQRPFVFLNACEAGVAGESLNQLGGLAGAFLIEGARGFVAPLWEIDDVQAREVALEFYRRTLGEGQTVGEAMCEMRRQYGANSTSATALAYVFYGNPDLRLQRTAA